MLASVGLTIGLSACGNVDEHLSPAPPSISGVVKNVHGGPGTVELLANPAQDNSSDTNPLVAQATMDAAGKFVLILPSAEILKPYMHRLGTDAVNDGVCAGQRISSTPTARSWGFNTLNVWRDGTYITMAFMGTGSTTYTVDTETRVFQSSSWWYVDQATTLSGSTTCLDPVDGRGTVTYESGTKLNAGWNLIAFTSTVVDHHGSSPEEWSIVYSLSSAAGPSIFNTPPYTALSQNRGMQTQHVVRAIDGLIY